MKLYQHAYGRVSRGFKSESPGYQTAALSPELAEHKKTVERLDKLSFYHSRSREGAVLPRYSFFKAGDGLLALGRAAMSYDLTGAATSFAHHFIWKEEDFLQSGISPARLMPTLPFLNGESELPDDRVFSPHPFPESLPTFEPDEKVLRKAVSLAERMIDGDRLSVPMVVIDEDEMWELLFHLFDLLPRQEASQAWFSSMFSASVEHLDSFRLVFVPDKSRVPQMAQVYDIFFPEDLYDLECRHEFTAFWRSHPELGQSLASLIDLLRHGDPASDRCAALAQALLSVGNDFRSVIERLDFEEILPLLLENDRLLQDYNRAGTPLSYDQLEDCAWEKPRVRLPVLLRLAESLGASGPLAQDLLADIGARISEQSANPEIFELVLQAGLGPDFHSVCQRRLKATQIMDLARILADIPGYCEELHRFVAVSFMRAAEDDQNRKAFSAWLREHREREKLCSALAAVLEDLSANPKKARPLKGFRLDSEDYRLLAAWLWDESSGRTLSLEECLDIVFDSKHRNLFFRMLSSRLGLMDTRKAGKLLDIFANSYGLCYDEIKTLVGTIEKTKGSNRGKLARGFLSALHDAGYLQDSIRERLESLGRKPGWMDRLSSVFFKNDR